MNSFGKLEVTAYFLDSEAGRARRCRLFSLPDVNERDAREFTELTREFFTRKAARYSPDPNDSSVEFVYLPHPTFM